MTDGKGLISGDISRTAMLATMKDCVEKLRIQV